MLAIKTTESRGEQQVHTLVPSKQNLTVPLQVLAKQVAQRVVLLQQDEVGGIGHACVSSIVSPVCAAENMPCWHTSKDLFRDVLLAILKQEELETAEELADGSPKDTCISELEFRHVGMFDVGGSHFCDSRGSQDAGVFVW
jgi:hypothetical protein